MGDKLTLLATMGLGNPLARRGKGAGRVSWMRPLGCGVFWSFSCPGGGFIVKCCYGEVGREEIGFVKKMMGDTEDTG